MDYIDVALSLLYGLVQGVTEWLPVSSTAHLMLLGRWLPMNVDTPFFNLFLVAVQLSSAFAVLIHYRHRLLLPLACRTRCERMECLSLWRCLVLGCVPAGAVGLFADDVLEELLARGDTLSIVIALSLSIYGVIFLLAERKIPETKGKTSLNPTIRARDAIKIGVFQILALIPGTSRSGATLLGGRLLGYECSKAAEFSFFLAVPIMLGATALRAVKLFCEGVRLSGGEILFLLLGMLASFLVSIVTLRFLVDFVERHGFSAFGWYRIALAVVVFCEVCF